MPSLMRRRLGFLALLENIIANRIADHRARESSYTAKLYAKGTGRIAQKVGEEGVETALAAVSRDDEAWSASRRPALPPDGAAQVP